MIFQDALSSLNPVYSVGFQIGEMFRAHRGTSSKEAKKLAVELMDRVRIPAAAQRVNDYPHQFSGGMRQRVMIAMAHRARPADPHRRRADHRARRHRAGADHGPAQGPAARDRHGPGPHHPRPRGGQRGRRQRRGHVRRPDRRARHGRRRLHRPGPPVHRGADELDPAGRGEGRPAAADRRPAAEPGRRSRRGCPFHPRCPRRRHRRRRAAGPRLRRRPAAAAARRPGPRGACHYSEEVLGV